MSLHPHHQQHVSAGHRHMAANPLLRKGRWSPSEDQRLMESIRKHGPNKWKVVAKDVGTRSGDQCWKRWNDSLDPSLNHSQWTPAEDETLEVAVANMGRCWSKIATENLNGRSGLACKNRMDHLDRKHRRAQSYCEQNANRRATLPNLGFADPHDQHGHCHTGRYDMARRDSMFPYAYPTSLESAFPERWNQHSFASETCEAEPLAWNDNHRFALLNGPNATTMPRDFSRVGSVRRPMGANVWPATQGAHAPIEPNGLHNSYNGFGISQVGETYNAVFTDPRTATPTQSVSNPTYYGSFAIPNVPRTGLHPAFNDGRYALPPHTTVPESPAQTTPPTHDHFLVSSGGAYVGSMLLSDSSQEDLTTYRPVAATSTKEDTQELTSQRDGDIYAPVHYSPSEDKGREGREARMAYGGLPETLADGSSSGEQHYVYGQMATPYTAAYMPRSAPGTFYTRRDHFANVTEPAPGASHQPSSMLPGLDSTNSPGTTAKPPPSQPWQSTGPTSAHHTGEYIPRSESSPAAEYPIKEVQYAGDKSDSSHGTDLLADEVFGPSSGSLSLHSSQSSVFSADVLNNAAQEADVAKHFQRDLSSTATEGEKQPHDAYASPLDQLQGNDAVPEAIGGERRGLASTSFSTTTAKIEQERSSGENLCQANVEVDRLTSSMNLAVESRLLSHIAQPSALFESSYNISRPHHSIERFDVGAHQQDLSPNSSLALPVSLQQDNQQGVPQTGDSCGVRQLPRYAAANAFDDHNLAMLRVSSRAPL